MKLIILIITAMVTIGFLGSTIALGVLYNKSQNEVLDLKEILANIYPPEKPICPEPKPDPKPLESCPVGSAEEIVTKSFVRVIKAYIDQKLLDTAPLYKKIASNPADYKEGMVELNLLKNDLYNIQQMQPQFDNCFVSVKFKEIMDDTSSFLLEKKFKDNIENLGTDWIPGIDPNYFIGYQNSICDINNKKRVDTLVGLIAKWIDVVNINDEENLTKMNSTNVGIFFEAQEEFSIQNFKLEKFLDIKRSFELRCRDTDIDEKNVGSFIPGGIFNGTTVAERSQFLKKQIAREFTG